MATIKGRRGLPIPVTDSPAERRARLERIAGPLVLLAALATIAVIGVLLRGVL